MKKKEYITPELEEIKLVANTTLLAMSEPTVTISDEEGDPTQDLD